MIRKSILILAMGWTLVVTAGDPRCPLIPMGAITGKPDEKQLIETLETYKAAGIDQFLIYPRSGLELEYMGEEWLQACEWICKHAKRLDMAIWLYDEYNWPSGSCKNRVQATNPDYCYRIYAVYRNKDGACEWKIVSTPDRVDNYSFDAMKLFMEMTHKKYEKRLLKYMGSTIKGVFTDEPGHATHVKVSGKPALRFRYFDGLDQEYKAETGHEFKTDVEAYLSDNNKDEVWAVYCDLLGKRFRKAFFDPIQTWCEKMGIQSTGHMIAENSTSDSARSNGNPLHVLKGLGLPGMDEIGTRTDPKSIEWITFGVAQHAVGRRGNGGLIELFALGPADMKHAVHRQMFWLSAMHKLDHYVMAVAPLDARGNVEKHAYFNPFTRMQPWFPAFKLLGEEARFAASYAGKPVHCDVGIRYPQNESARLSIKKKQHFWLRGTLRRFAINQITYDLYEEDEPCDKPFVFSFSAKDKTFKEENSGKVFELLDDAVAFMREKRPPVVEVVDAEGAIVKNLLLRHYRDGSVVVLDLSAESRKSLHLKRKGKEDILFNLSSRGVFVLDANGKMNGAEPSGGTLCSSVPPETAYDLTLSTDNTCRLVFNSEKKARFTVANPLQDVRIVVRNYTDASGVLLDGKPVEAVVPCDRLIQGFKTLYMQSSPINLSAGEHTMTIAKGSPDNNFFLPVALLAGPFAAEEQSLLKPLEAKVKSGTLTQQGLPGFTGQVTYSAMVDVPDRKGDLRLKLETGGLYTAVSLNGEELGERAWIPYDWKVPAKFRGKKVKLTVCVWTSVLPLFGDWKHPAAGWGTKFWVPPASGRTEVGLTAPPEWVLF